MGQDTASVTILATTDLHGHLLPYDYFTQQPAAYGLAKAATLIAEVRKEVPGALLVDAGDTIQGSPLAGVYNNFKQSGRLPKGVTVPARVLSIDPTILAMNALGYEAMAVGNHEFNYGLGNLDAARRASRFAWLSANTAASGPSTKPFVPYLERTVNGVRVALIGLTTPAIPQWEKPAHYAGYTWEDPIASVRRLLELWGKDRPDLVVVLAHGGIDKTAAKNTLGVQENFAWQVAEIPGVDAVIFGHTHREVAEEFNGNAILLQPKNYGASVGRLDFTFARNAEGRWQIQTRRGRLLKVKPETPADEQIQALVKPYHEATEQYLSSVMAEAPAALSAATGRFEDNPLVDAVHEVQLHYTNADVSLTALFNPRLKIAAGPVTVREAAALYVFDNTLYKIEGNGKMLREALENAARYFQSCLTPGCESGELINQRMAGYNFDMAEGVSYELDLAKPEGQRVQSLRFRGAPLRDEQPLTIALNNYRAAGSAGYDMFKGAKILWESRDSIRELLVEYFASKKTLPSSATKNWKIVPEAARERLLKNLE